MVVINEPKTIYFDFDLPKSIDNNWKQETEYIKKSHEALARNKIISETEQLL